MRKTLLLILISCLIVSPCFAEEIDVFKLAENGTLDQLQEALNNGAKFNVKGEDGETPLHRAASSNKNVDVTKFLIEQWLDVNAEWEHRTGFTPLLLAIVNSNSKVAVELLKLGANPNYIDGYPMSILQHLMGNDTINENERKEIITAMLQKGVNVNYQGDGGVFLSTITALMSAVRNDKPEIVSLLLDANADLSLKDEDGKTALDYANELPDSSALKKSPAFERLKASTTIKTEVKSANTIMPDTLPEASIELAKLYVTYDYDRDFFVDMQKLQYKERPSSFGDIIKEISNFQNRNTYTEEQVKYKIGRMIDNGQFPANYILAKGQYKYDSNINAVYPTTNLNLRSQPNTKARIITELYGGEVQVEGYIAHNAATYLGEWTSPQGDKWTAVEYLDNLHDDKKKLGWVSSKYVRLITNEQIREIINVINNEVMSDGGFAVKQYALAIAYDRNGEHDRARECIEKYMEDHPEITPYEVARQLYSEGMYQVAYDLIRKNLNTFDSKFLFAEIWTYHQNDIKIQDDDPITVGVFIGENIRRDKRVVDLDYAKREMRTAKDYYKKAFTYYACNNYTGPEFVDNLRIAAEMGYADAQYYWAEILAEGLHGVRQDETAAYNYFKKAAAQGHQDAKAILSLYQLLYRRY